MKIKKGKLTLTCSETTSLIRALLALTQPLHYRLLEEHVRLLDDLFDEAEVP